MAQISPELEAVIGSIVLLECKIEAIMRVLHENGVRLNFDEVDSLMHKIHGTQYEVKRHEILSRIKDSNVDRN
jgi:hypothetical protein